MIKIKQGVDETCIADGVRFFCFLLISSFSSHKPKSLVADWLLYEKHIFLRCSSVLHTTKIDRWLSDDNA